MKSIKKIIAILSAAGIQVEARQGVFDSKTFDSYESMHEYAKAEPFTAVLYWWYIPEGRRD